MKGYVEILHSISDKGLRVPIYAPMKQVIRGKCWFSFANSPYPGHVAGSSVDIYSEHPYLPVEKAKVSKLLHIPTPKERSDASPEDWVIVLDLGDIAIKILHVEPSLRIGESLFIGDPIGKFIISGYFFPWTEPHMHVEVRKINDPLRALGGYPLVPSVRNLLNMVNPSNCASMETLELVYKGKTFSLLRPVNGGPICGSLSKIKGIVDGGIPHYGYGSLIPFEHAEEDKAQKAEVKAGALSIGNSVAYFNRRFIFIPSCIPLINEKELKGMGFFVLRREIKAIGLIKDAEVGDLLQISCHNTHINPNKNLLRVLGRFRIAPDKMA